MPSTVWRSSRPGRSAGLKALTADVGPAATSFPITSEGQGNGVKHRQFPNLFALVIGIDQYLHSRRTGAFRDLAYCTADANAVADFLRTKLGVSRENIRNLRNAEATRENIIAGIKAFGSDDRIRKDLSSIFIFFAGHGATSSHLSTKLQYEVLCPYDVTTHSSLRTLDQSKKVVVSGIPDYEIQSLINDIASKKGNNITLFLDCCHSAGMNRTASLVSERRMNCPSPLSDMAYPVEKSRMGVPLPAAVGRNHQSHVLLASCGKEETAKECGHLQHGWLTAALLRLLGEIPIECLTYDTLLKNLDVHCPRCTDSSQALCSQTPHCDGVNIDRHIFSTTTQQSLIRGHADGLSRTIPSGSVAGILPESRFYIYRNEQATSPLGILVAKEVLPGSSKLEPLPDHSNFLVPRNFFAWPLTWFATFSVFCDDLPKLDIVFSRSDRETYGIVITDDKTSADFWIDFSGLDVMLYRGYRHPESEVIGSLFKRTIPTQLERILSGASTFYHHLYRTSPYNFDKVSTEFFYLNLSSDLSDATIESTIPLENTVEIGSLFTKRMKIILDQPIQGKLWSKPIGMRLHNASPYDLYPYVFFFSPGALSINAWNSIPHAERPDFPLPCNSTLSIGFGGYAIPWGFNLEKGQTHDVTYIKIFLTTIPCQALEHIAQHPFRCESRLGDPSLGVLNDSDVNRHVPYRSKRGICKSRLPPVMPVLSRWDVQIIQVVQEARI